MDAFLCEYSTIGALLIDPEAYPEAAELRPDDFLHPAFAAVFRAIQRRNDAGTPSSLGCLRGSIARKGGLYRWETVCSCPRSSRH